MNTTNKKKTKNESVAFLQKHFQLFYQQNPLPAPDRPSRREYAFLFFNGYGMIRHLHFSRQQQLQNFVKNKAPMHAYYSTAYYRKPDQRSMKEKQWMGAELIFDLDADHLPNADQISYEEQLELVKIEFIKLVDDFLIHDFGFPQEQMKLYFSGGRGYHCHVNHPAAYQLTSDDRREIVDYITGRGLIESIVLREESMGQKQIKGKTVSTGKRLRMPSVKEPGWRGRISRGLLDTIDEIVASDDPISQLKRYGVREHTAKKLINDLSEERVQRIKQGNIDQTTTIRRFFLNNAVQKKAVSSASGETDEPVTCDVKRLIRLPGSLHGKTGLQVTPVSLNTIDSFDPLADAVVFGKKTTTVYMYDDATVKLKNKTYTLLQGKNDVPLFVAIFVVGKRMATLKKPRHKDEIKQLKNN